MAVISYLKMNNLNDEYYRLALRNSIYHSISSLVYKECGVRLPTLYMLYIEYKVNPEDIKTFIINEGYLW